MVARWHLAKAISSITKTRTIILFANTTLIRLAFGVIATGQSHSRNNETEDMLLYQSNPVGVKLFSYLNTFVGFILITQFLHRHPGERMPPLIYSAESSLTFGLRERVHTTQPNYSFLFVRKVVHISGRHVCKAVYKCH